MTKRTLGEITAEQNEYLKNRKSRRRRKKKKTPDCGYSIIRNDDNEEIETAPIAIEYKHQLKRIFRVLNIIEENLENNTEELEGLLNSSHSDSYVSINQKKLQKRKFLLLDHKSYFDKMYSKLELKLKRELLKTDPEFRGGKLKLKCTLCIQEFTTLKLYHAVDPSRYSLCPRCRNRKECPICGTVFFKNTLTCSNPCATRLRNQGSKKQYLDKVFDYRWEKMFPYQEYLNMLAKTMDLIELK